jgi:hypothetical protein
MDGVRRIECTLYTDDLAAVEVSAKPDRSEIVNFIHAILDAIENAYPSAHVMVTEVQAGRRHASGKPAVKVECDGDGNSICRQISGLIEREARRHFGSHGSRFVA